MKTFWLSFCDDVEDKFLGVCLVEVNDDDIIVADGITSLLFPKASENAGDITAALLKANEMKCNPGGQVLGVEITSNLLKKVAKMPRHKLMSIEELVAGGWV